MIVRESTVAEIEAAATFPALLAEYAAEAAMDGMPPPAAKMASYRALEAAGLLRAIGAFDGGVLIGFITVLVVELPHYGVGPAVSESWFVARASRHTGAGMKLLRTAEALAKLMGAPVQLVSVRSGSDLEGVLPRAGYAECNRVFAKKVSDG